MKKIFVLFSLLLNFSSSVLADTGHYVDGNKLYNGLISNKPVESLMSKYYIFGVVDTRFDSCIPNDVQGNQLFDVVKQYLSNNPETRQLSGSLLVEIAIKEKFKCK